VHEDVKEIIAPIIMRDSAFSALITNSTFKYANEKQQLLTLQVNDTRYAMVEYCDTLYHNTKKDG
jgi:hypothetical protein